MASLVDKPTSERTNEELEAAYEAYILSKTVNGRYCPTPDLTSALERDDDEEEERAQGSNINYYPRTAATSASG